VAPAVTLTAPADGASYAAPATITLSANASDSDGTIARVDFFAGATLIASDTASPFTVTFNGVAAGSYSLTAVATDDHGASSTSAARSVTVTQAPSVRRAAFTPSADHGTLVNSYLLEVFASGADPRTAAPVATQNLGKPAVVNGDCTADVTATLDRLAPGNYVATVAAVGNGGSTRSAPIPFTR
jgi:hypothetical protein